MFSGFETRLRPRRHCVAGAAKPRGERRERERSATPRDSFRCQVARLHPGLLAWFVLLVQTGGE